MRIAIISDIHANLEALQSTLQDISISEADQVLCLGDIIGYNSNPEECIELLRTTNVLCIAGNHDRAVTRQIATRDFDYVAAKVVRWTRRHLSQEALRFLANLPVMAYISNELIAVHGALHPKSGQETVRLDNDERLMLSLKALAASCSGARVCAFGHTHQLGIFELRDGIMKELKGDHISLHENGYYLINPGAVGQPRTSDHRATYLILDTVHKVVTIHRVEYDIAVPLVKTQRAGLLPVWTTLPPLIRSVLKTLPKPIRKTLTWLAELLRL